MQPAAGHLPARLLPACRAHTSTAGRGGSGRVQLLAPGRPAPKQGPPACSRTRPLIPSCTAAAAGCMLGPSLLSAATQRSNPRSSPCATDRGTRIQRPGRCPQLRWCFGGAAGVRRHAGRHNLRGLRSSQAAAASAAVLKAPASSMLSSATGTPSLPPPTQRTPPPTLIPHTCTHTRPQREGDLLEAPQREALAAMLADHGSLPAAAPAAGPTPPLPAAAVHLTGAAAGWGRGPAAGGSAGSQTVVAAGGEGASGDAEGGRGRPVPLPQGQLVAVFRGWQAAGGPAWREVQLECS